MTCGAATAATDALVASNAVAFPGITLLDGQTCTVRVDVTDAVGQTANDTNTVTVDRRAPTVAIVSPGDILDVSADLAPEAGIQAPLTVDLGGVQAGQVAHAVLSWSEAGVPQSKEILHTVATDTADGATYVAAFEEAPGTGYITWPQGFVTVTVSIVDLAGNPGLDTQNTAVDVQGAVRITSPSDTASSCTGSCAIGVCHDGACYRTWGANDTRRLVAFVSNIFTTANNVRVCSDHPAVAAAPGAVACASAGFFQVLLGNSAGGNTNLDVSAVLPDGYQRLVVEALAVSGGNWASSLAAVAETDRERRVVVDLGAPVVTNLGSPSDVLAPANALNKAELAAPGGQYLVKFTASEAARADLYVNGGIIATQNVPAGDTTLTVTLPQGQLQIWVVLTDTNGNASPLTPGAGALTYNVLVDFTPPTLVFLQPNKPVLNASDTLAISLSSDAEGLPVGIVKDGVGQVGAPLVTNGVATLPPANTAQVLIEGSSTLWAYVTDAAGNQTVTAKMTVLVDTVPPSATIDAPADGTALTDVDDADFVADGYQVNVDFTTGNGASSWALYLATGCDAAGQNCQPRTLEASGAGSGAMSQMVTVDLTGADTNARFTLEALDDAGNLASSTTFVTITVTACQLSFTNLPAGGWYNVANGCPGGTPCASADIAITVSAVGACLPISRIDLLNNGAVVGTQNSSGAATFDLTVADGDHLVLEARAYQDVLQVASTGTRTRDADFTPPDVAFVARSVDGFMTAAEGSSVTYTTANDLQPGVAGLQFSASIDVADTHAASGRVTTATATSGAGTVNLTPSNITLPFALAGASPIRVDLDQMTLADGQTHTVVVTAQDAAGNADTATFTATVDASAPAEVPITGVRITRRRPIVAVDFTQVGADGMTGGPATKYEVRYSASPIDATNFASACLATAPELLGSSAAPVPAAPGTADTATIGGPDTRPFSDACKLDIPTEHPGEDNVPWLYVAIRAQDALGNWSPITSQAVRAITFAEAWLSIDTVKLDNTSGAFVGYSPSNMNDLTFDGTAIGDVNDDGVEDFAFGSFQAQGFCVMLGHTFAGDETLTAPSGPNHTCLMTNPLGAGAHALGHRIAALGDVNGDGIADFGVSGRLTTTASVGAVAIYLGRAGQLPDLSAPNVIIKGMLPSGTFAYFGLCGAGDFDGVLDGSGKATNDIVITAIPSTSQNYLMVFPGQTTWTSATSLTIDVASPAAVTANGGLTINWSAATGGNFGVRCAPVGDVLPTPAGAGTGAKDDFIVSQTGSIDARIFVVPGREWAAGQTETLTSSDDPAALVTAEDQRTVRLRQDNDTELKSGFGTVMFGRFDFNNDGVDDVVVGNPNRSADAATCTPQPSNCASPTFGDGKTIHIFDGSKLAGAAGQPSWRITAPTAPGNPPEDFTYVGTNGWIVRASLGGSPTSPYPRSVRPIGDFNAWTVGGQPTVDLAISNYRGNELSLRSNTSGGPKAFVLGTFPVMDGFAENINFASGTNESIGTWIDGGWDMSGDALPDLIAGSRKAQLIIVR